MEKRNTSGLRIAITGPESTGKSLMAKHLAMKFGGVFIPEYARDYIQSIDRHYEYTDLENIAKKQLLQYKELESNPTIVFFDTWLIITKVWFEWVYNKIPEFIEESMRLCPIDLYLLLKPDIPWEADPTRENGGENREKLYERYKQELEKQGFNYIEIGGFGEERFASAEKEIACLLK